jgi:FkbM family methyltransferase
MINRIKLFLKENLPTWLYHPLYIVWRLFLDIVEGKSKSSKLILFNKKKVVTVAVKRGQFSLIIDPKNGGVDNAIFLDGIYEKEIIDTMCDIITPFDVCIDIGANIGQHTLAASLFAKNGEVYAFEPNAKLFSQLQKSVSLNNAKNVYAYHFGLGETDEVKKLYSSNLNMGMSSIIKPEAYSSVSDVKIRNFDLFWAKNKPISFVKIDIEGGEISALKGMKCSISVWKPVIIMEYNGRSYSQDDLSFFENLLKINQYQIFSIPERKEISFKDCVSIKALNILLVPQGRKLG